MLKKSYDKEAIREILKDVIDPEMGMNIVDLGLVYDIKFEADYIAVEFTLTTPYCPLEEYMTMSIGKAVIDATGETCYPQLVWDPPWSPMNMSEEARIAFGM